MAHKRTCVFIPLDGYVEGHGWRVSIVVENEGGHCPTGTWPYTGKAGESMPWFWGPSYQDAKDTADEYNRQLGIEPHDAAKIVLSSMGRPIVSKLSAALR